MKLLPIDTPGPKSVPIKMEPAFFIDTRFSTQKQIQNKNSIGILRKQQFALFDLRIPLRENVYETERAGINSKLYKKQCQR